MADIQSTVPPHEGMRRYVHEVIRAQEDERKRIARELHDDVAPLLLLLIQRIDVLAASKLKVSECQPTIEDLRCQTVEALESLRRIAQDLRPRILDDLGLVAALEWMADNLIRKHGIEARVELIGRERGLSSEVQLLLFRIAQESVNNIRKHAEATLVVITVEFTEEKTVLTIRDNGKGFATPETLGDLAASGRLGLAGMQERAQLLRGSIEIHSEPGQGTSVTVEVPAGATCLLPSDPTVRR